MNKLLTALILVATALTAQAQDAGGFWGWVKDHSCGGKWSCSDVAPAASVKTAQVAKEQFFKGETEKQTTEIDYSDCRNAVAAIKKTSIYHQMDLGNAYLIRFYTDKYRVSASCGKNQTTGISVMILEKEKLDNPTVVQDFLK
jgi:hypothetical protein